MSLNGLMNWCFSSRCLLCDEVETFYICWMKMFAIHREKFAEYVKAWQMNCKINLIWLLTEDASEGSSSTVLWIFFNGLIIQWTTIGKLCHDFKAKKSRDFRWGMHLPSFPKSSQGESSSLRSFTVHESLEKREKFAQKTLWNFEWEFKANFRTSRSLLSIKQIKVTSLSLRRGDEK